jgi:hypothetical protein
MASGSLGSRLYHTSTWPDQCVTWRFSCCFTVTCMDRLVYLFQHISTCSDWIGSIGNVTLYDLQATNCAWNKW